VPDGYVRLCSSAYEYVLYFEADRNSESREKIIAKLNNYKALATQCECMAVTFCVVSGGDLRVKTLRNWATDVITNTLRELFLFAPIDLEKLTPQTFYLDPSWLLASDTTSHPLVEI